MSKVVIYRNDDFYSHPELEVMGTFEDVSEIVEDLGLSTDDIYFDDECRDETVNNISENILKYVKSNYPDAIALILIGSQSNWRGLFTGGSVIPLDGDIREEVFFKCSMDFVEISAEEGETPIMHYANHDWSCYMSLEVILKEHLSKQLVEDIESEIFDQEEVMTHLINNPRSNPIHVPYEGFVGQLY